MKRKVQKRVLLAGIVVLAVSTLNGWAEEPRGQTFYDHTIELSVSQPNFHTDFGATKGGFINELWAVAGSSNLVGQAFVQRIGTGNLEIGDTNFQFGTVFYHFHTNDLFNGGTVTNSANYQGGAQHLYVATTDIEPTSSNGWSGFDPLSTIPSQKKFYDQFWGEGTYTVDLPIGVKDFWVVISKPDDQSSNNAFERSLDVNPNVIVDPNGCVNGIVSDVNDDCSVDFSDFGIVAASWLECTDADNPAECYPF